MPSPYVGIGFVDFFFLSWVSLAAASRNERLTEKVEGDLREQMSESEDLW